MRITAEDKAKNRERILDAACNLFQNNGFHATTTRQIASACDLAAGTLFNYFSSKEALAMTLVAERLESVPDEYRSRRRGSEDLVEDLFLFIVTGLRALGGLREVSAAALEAAWSPFAKSGAVEIADRMRAEHLDTVGQILAAHGPQAWPSPMAIHLYWTLYVGVLGHWARDESDHQTDTLVVLDESIRLFVASLRTMTNRESDNGIEHG